LAICIVGKDQYFLGFARPHTHHSSVEARYHLASAGGKRQRIAPNRAIKNLPVGQRSGLVHSYHISLFDHKFLVLVLLSLQDK
jgi:hypothetical protein